MCGRQTKNKYKYLVISGEDVYFEAKEFDRADLSEEVTLKIGWSIMGAVS